MAAAVSSASTDNFQSDARDISTQPSQRSESSSIQVPDTSKQVSTTVPRAGSEGGVNSTEACQHAESEDKQDEKGGPGVKDDDSAQSKHEAVKMFDNKTFVEAPIPKTNPWTKSKNVPQVAPRPVPVAKPKPVPVLEKGEYPSWDM
jgi:hypothetical protein